MFLDINRETTDLSENQTNERSINNDFQDNTQYNAAEEEANPTLYQTNQVDEIEYNYNYVDTELDKITKEADEVRFSNLIRESTEIQTEPLTNVDFEPEIQYKEPPITNLNINFGFKLIHFQYLLFYL